MTRMLMGLLVSIGLTACGAERSTEAAGSAGESARDATETPALVGTRWQWIGTISPTERVEVADPARYTLIFLPDGRVDAQFDCNGGGGGYELADNRLSFGPMMATRMACSPGSQDTVFMRQLGEISSYFIADGELYLEMSSDSGTMRFAPATAR